MLYKDIDKNMKKLHAKYGLPQSVQEEEIYIDRAIGHITTDEEFEEWLTMIPRTREHYD